MSRRRTTLLGAAAAAMTLLAAAPAYSATAPGQVFLPNPVAVAFDGPSRQALIPRLVPPADLPGALTLNLSVFQASLIGGPALAGLIVAHAADGTRGLATIYLVNTL